MNGTRFARIPERVIRCRELSRIDLRVFACISLHADASGRAWPSVAAIAEMTGVRAQDVSRTIRRLMRLVGLQCERGGGRGNRSVYVIPLRDSEPENIRTGADVKGGENIRSGAGIKGEKHPQNDARNIRKTTQETSAPVRRTYKQTKEQTKEHPTGGAGAPARCRKKPLHDVGYGETSAAELFALGKRVLGPKTGGIVNQLVQACGGNRDRARELLDGAEGLESPRGRIMWHITKLKEAAEEEKRLYRDVEGCAGDYVEPATDWEAEYRRMGVSI